MFPTILVFFISLPSIFFRSFCNGQKDIIYLRTLATNSAGKIDKIHESKRIKNTKIVSDILNFQGAVINQTILKIGGVTFKIGKINRGIEGTEKGSPKLNCPLSLLFKVNTN